MCINDEQVQRNLSPGVVTASGFLGHDYRSYSNIVNADNNTMAFLGLDYQAVADRLRGLLDAAVAGQGTTVTVHDVWLAEMGEATAIFPFPWDEGVYHRFNVDEKRLQNPKWLVTCDESKGSLPCPWQDGAFHKFNVTIELLEQGRPSGQKLVVNELSIHLIETHQFLQGAGSPYRLEPSALKTILAL